MIVFEQDKIILDSNAGKSSGQLQAANAVLSLLKSNSYTSSPQNSRAISQILELLEPQLTESEHTDLFKKLKSIGPSCLKIGIAKKPPRLSILDSIMKSEVNNLTKRIYNASLDELYTFSKLPELSAVTTSALISRGIPEINYAVLANETAQFSKSTLTMIVELAASDQKLKNFLVRRVDVPEILGMKIIPYLNEQQKVVFFTSGARIDSKSAAQLLASERDLFSGNGVDPSRDIDDSVLRLCSENRLCEMAAMLAERLYLPLGSTLNFLYGKMDHVAGLLLNAAGAKHKSALKVVGLRKQILARKESDLCATYDAFDNYSIDDSGNIISKCSKHLQNTGLVTADFSCSPDLLLMAGY